MSLSKMLEELPRSQARFCPQLVDAMRDNTPLSVPALLSFLALISFMAAPAYAAISPWLTKRTGTIPTAA